ncbi:IucA/IucC family protein [Streptomyces sp. CA-111067]|uniref:IucA/IucC family protein n=1 Tax=Streptomyces sp. CA-111067 TaxID=3240046 RepID=UPI003D995B84
MLLRVLSTFLREDVCGLRTRTRVEDRPDGRWLRLSGGQGKGNGQGRDDLLLPVESDGFQCEYAARLPVIRVEPPREVGEFDGMAEPPATDASRLPTPAERDSTAPGLTAPPSARGETTGREPAGPKPAGGEPARCGAEPTGPGPAGPKPGRPGPAEPQPQPQPQPNGTGPGNLDLTEPQPGGPEPIAPDRARPGSRGREVGQGEEILRLIGEFGAAEDAAGFDAFVGEYRDALAALRLQGDTRDETMARLRGRFGGDPADWRGAEASLAFDTLAARLGHPLYPTSAARPGVSSGQLLRYAPEFAPTFALRWLAVPRDALTVSGTGPGEPLAGFWPTPGELGLGGLDRTHVALPVHPLTVGEPLREALRAAGLAERAVLADRAFLEGVPTLSTRTVALREHPSVHLKLPLATATLGRLNRRTIKPGTLVDGAAAQRLLEAVTAREPRFQGLVLHCDETRWAHAGHELLAVLVRRQPTLPADCTVLPLAALPAAAPDGRLVVDHLADRHAGGDPVALLDAVLTPLLNWQATLFGYGIALESHQQNISLLLDQDDTGATRVRLLFKDDDGLRVNRHRLAAAQAPAPADFDDPRITVDDDGPLLAMFTTITVHLCAGALAFALSGPGRAPLPRLLGLIRDRLDQAAAQLDGLPGDRGRILRAAVLESDRLPVKAMLTAGTLLTKQRSGAADINKHYTTGPNYLLREPR